MPPPAVVPVLFDEAAITYDLDRLPASARVALQALRKQIQRDSGLSTTRLKGCAAEADDGTRLPHCLKTYVPWEQNRWGLVFSRWRTRSDRSRYAPSRTATGTRPGRPRASTRSLTSV